MAFVFENNYLGIKSKDSFFSLNDYCKDKEEAFYIYDLDAIEQRFNFFREGFSGNKNKIRIHYAMKANSHPEILKKLKSLGAHVDVVSLGEIKLAMKNNFLAEDIVFSGVGKSKHELTEALKLGVYQINVESTAELTRIGEIAKKLNVKASVGIRFNPDVNPETHPYITTGFRENKFGLDFSEISNIDKIKQQFADNIILRGVSIHIGSQIRDNSSFIDALEKTLKHFKLIQSNPNWEATTLDIGGGLGINYDNPDVDSDLPLITEYTDRLTKVLNTIDADIICEPGRVLVGRFGVLVSKVEYIKQNEYKNFAILNTGMHHIMRPCLYKAHHNILAVDNSERKNVLYDVVGPICESSDVLGFKRILPELKQDDWVAIMDAGAYGFVMASGYNQHVLPDEFVVEGGKIL